MATVSSRAQDVQRLADRLQERDADFAAEAVPIVAELRAAEREVAALAASRELTPIGIEARVKARLARAERALAPFEQDTARLLDQLTRDEDAVANPRVELTPEDRLLIGQWFAALAPDRHRREYEAAIANGDLKTVAVIEGLPTSISPLDDAARQRARERKLARLPAEQAAALAKERARLTARTMLADAARRALRDLGRG